MLAESGEERGAMMGVHRESTHQLTCVLTDLCEWVEGWMLFSGLTAALLALCVPIVSAKRAATFTAPVLPTHSHTPHHTKHTAGERASHSVCTSAGDSGGNAVLTLPA